MYQYNLTPAGQPQQNNNQQQQQPQQQMIAPGIPPDVFIQQMMAQTRSLLAVARFQESVILLNGMAEIRAALNVPSVSESDTGMSERTPLKPMFQQDQIAQLQNAYLSYSERYLKFANHVMSKELKIGKSEENKSE